MLKVDAVSNGYQGAIYDDQDPSRTPVWRCICTPVHTTKAEAKVCAKSRLNRLRGKKK